MEQTTELRLAWRQEFATALLNELIIGGDVHSDRLMIQLFCNDYIFAEDYTLRNFEMCKVAEGVMKKLINGSVADVITYLRTLEDVFTDCKMCLN